MPPMSDANNAILLACLCITTPTIIYTGIRLYNSYSNVALLLLIANLLYLPNNISTLIYNNVNWLDPHPRYFIAYTTIDASVIILYYVYEERLVLLLQAKYRQYFKYSMLFALAVYIVVCIIQIAMFTYYATNTSSGGYNSAGTGLNQIKMTVMLVDIFIAAAILFMTLLAVSQLVAGSKNVGSNSSKDLYMSIITSDFTKFVAVFTVDIYKASSSVNPNVGALPVGNLGFSHLLDTVKILLMTMSLIAPAVVHQMSANSSTKNSSKGGGKSAVGSALKATSSAHGHTAKKKIADFKSK
ncbi:hypothetical protein HK100_003114 [Physocladia obscura]|uniref:Uncharacterized protein n=1 Tax=Physocladia obscura TaxID=109957 RepID=A0AAD5SXB0_9FUNG|nr:hypothetical protein HK100_003114 [Physocladia obscura]